MYARISEGSFGVGCSIDRETFYTAVQSDVIPGDEHSRRPGERSPPFQRRARVCSMALAGEPR